LKNSLDAEIDELRSTTHMHLETLQNSEKRSIERATLLRGELASLHQELSDNRQALKVTAKEVTAKQDQLSEMRNELHSLENETDMTEVTVEQEKQQQRLQQQAQTSDLEEEELEAKEELARAGVSNANQKDDARAMYALDITRIRDKVGTLLTRKDNAARDMKRQLQMLREQSTELEDTLERQRAQQLSTVTDSTDFEGLDGTGLMQKLNIGNIDISTGTRVTGTGTSTARRAGAAGVGGTNHSRAK